MGARQMKFTVGVLFLLGLAWLHLLHNTFSLPDPAALRLEPPRATRFMQAHEGEIQYEWVPLAEISPHLQRAVIVSEDERFFEHAGFDWAAIKQAARRNWQRRRFSFGASTITQQLAKNLYLSASKNPFRKLKELLIALTLERELSKERILELYLNVVEWGPGIYGAQAAAQYYFGSEARYVSKTQAAFLASILPNPRVLGRRGFRMSSRAQRIVRGM